MNKDYFASLRGKHNKKPLGLSKAVGDISRGVSIGPVKKTVTIFYSKDTDKTELALLLMFCQWRGIAVILEVDNKVGVLLVQAEIAGHVFEYKGFLNFVHQEAEI